MEKERPYWTFENEEQGGPREKRQDTESGRNNPLRESDEKAR